MQRSWKQYSPVPLAAVLLLAACADGGRDVTGPAGPLAAHQTTQPFMFSGPAVAGTEIMDPGNYLINGAVWTSVFPLGVGTGVINPFLSIQRRGQEHGFNTDASPLPLDATRPQFTHALPLNIVPVFSEEITGIQPGNQTLTGPWREFILDANETSSGDGPKFSIDAFDLYICNTGSNAPATFNAAQFQAAITAGDCDLIYDIGAASLRATSEHTAGSGQDLDYRILVPASAFPAQAASDCPYNPDAAPCGWYVILYSHMGGLGGIWQTEATFEEFSTVRREVVAPGQITVAKACVGSQAGEDFGFTIGGVGSGTFTRDCGESAIAVGPTNDFGVYTIEEDVLPAGWHFTSLVCSKGTVVDASVSIDLQTGDNVLCTFTNTIDAATIDIEKQTVGGTGTFNYTVGGSGWNNFSRSTTVNNPSQNAPFQFSGTDATGDKFVTEVVPAGWTLTNIQCTANGATIVIGFFDNGTFMQGATAGFDIATDNAVKITLSPGDSPTCLFTNTKIPRVQLIKHFDPSTDPGLVEFDINGTTFDNAGQGFGHGGTTGFVEVGIGNVTVSETGFGTDLSLYTSVLVCVYADNSPVTVNPNTGTSGTFAIAAGEDITCTFTNAPIPTAEWCSPGFWRNNWANWDASAWPQPAANFANMTYASLSNELLPGYTKPALSSGDPNTVTVLDILQSPQTYGGQAFNYVGTFLSLEAGLNVQLDEFGQPIENCVLNQGGSTS